MGERRRHELASSWSTRPYPTLLTRGRADTHNSALTPLCLLAAEGITKAVAQRVITDMLGSIQDTAGGGWKVLLLDEFTTK